MSNDDNKSGAGGDPGPRPLTPDPRSDKNRAFVRR